MTESFEYALKRITDKIEEAEAGRLRWNSAEESWDYYEDACSRLESAHKHEIEHMGKAEYHRGHTDGIKARDASMWRLEREREEAVRNIASIDTDMGGFVKKLAEALGIEWKAPNPTQNMCEIKKRLIHLLGDRQKGDEMTVNSDCASQMTVDGLKDTLRKLNRDYEEAIQDFLAEIERLTKEVGQLTDQLKSVDAKPMTDENMTEAGWIRLPKDKNGEYIHIGDRVEDNERVARIVLTDGIREPSVYIEKLPNVLHEYFCNDIGHYHAPTVEQVIHDLTLGKITESQAVERIEALHGC